MAERTGRQIGSRTFPQSDSYIMWRQHSTAPPARRPASPIHPTVPAPHARTPGPPPLPLQGAPPPRRRHPVQPAVRRLHPAAARGTTGGAGAGAGCAGACRRPGRWGGGRRLPAGCADPSPACPCCRMHIPVSSVLGTDGAPLPPPPLVCEPCRPARRPGAGTLCARPAAAGGDAGGWGGCVRACGASAVCRRAESGLAVSQPAPPRRPTSAWDRPTPHLHTPRTHSTLPSSPLFSPPPLPPIPQMPDPTHSDQLVLRRLALARSDPVKAIDAQEAARAAATKVCVPGRGRGQRGSLGLQQHQRMPAPRQS